MVVSLNELVCQFAGERIPDDQQDPDQPCVWATEPTYAVSLACEIAKRTDPSGEFALRRTIYGDLQPELIDPDALEAIQLGWQRYKTVTGHVR